jgi:hypothetical protein
VTLELRILGFIDNTHTTFAEFLYNFVMRHDLTDHFFPFERSVRDTDNVDP